MFAVLVIVNWGLGEFLAFQTINWHFYLGYSILGLLMVRLYLGLCGPQSARFTALPLSPHAIIESLRSFFARSPTGAAGHTAMGALSIVAMLVAVLLQATTGLFVESEEFFETGPLAQYVSDSLVSWITRVHHFNAKVLLVLVGLHVSAIAYYRVWKREDLLTPMITGWKWVKRID